MTQKQPLPSWDRVDGVLGKTERLILAKKQITIVGVGSNGSEITRQLVMSGVGSFNLVDPDILEATNVVRHVLGLTSLGKSKVEEMKHYLLTERNPKVKVKTFVEDARFNQVIFKGSDLVIISGLGSNARQSLIADQARSVGIPVICSGVFTKGVGGETFVIYPQGACYACISSFVGRKLDEDSLRDRTNPYGAAPDEVAAMPALATDIVRISTFAAEWSLKVLLGRPVFEGDSRVNLMVFANRRHRLGKDKTGDVFLEPYESQFAAVAQSKACLVCNNKLTQTSIESLIS